MLDDVDFVGNSSGSWWLITGYHDNLDTSRSALGDGKINHWSWWIVQGDDTDKGEVVHWERASGALVVSSGLFWVEAPVLPGLHIKFVVGLGVFLSWEVVSSESENSLSEGSEIFVGLFDLISELLGEFLSLTVDENLGASSENSLWGTLKDSTKVGISTTLGRFGHISNEHVELDVGTEWNKALGLLAVLTSDDVSWELSSCFIKIHNSLSELNETSLGGITFAVSSSVEEVLLSSLQSGLHFLGVSGGKLSSLKRGNSDFVDSGIELLGLIIRWVVVEDGVGSEDDSLNK